MGSLINKRTKKILMHKTFYLACILGCAIAEDMGIETKMKEGAVLAGAKSGDVESGGQIFEIWA